MSSQYSLIWKDVNFIPKEPISKRLLSLVTCGMYSRNEKRKVTLSGSQGVIRQGELVALMGPSGAGKSTLLKSLTLGKNHVGFDGKVIVQGLPDNVAVRGRNIGQHEREHLIATLTVSESLRYASQLRNRNASKEEHEKYVTDYLAYLKLTNDKDTLVGRCSGGMTKRLAVGLELIAVEKPHFLFLDEPTSGLDSHIGEMLIQFLAECAQQYKMTIITTIHQPKQSVLERFSRVFILACDGNIMYNLAPGYLPGYLEQCGFNIHEKRASRVIYDSPADIAVQIALKHQPDDVTICNAMVEKAKSYTNPDVELQQNRPCKTLETGLCSVEATFSFFTLLTLLRRTTLITWRQLKFILIRFMLHAVVAGVLVALYDRNIGQDNSCIVIDPKLDPRNCSCGVTVDDLQKESVSSTNVKFQFFSLLFLMFAALMPTVLTFPSEIKIFLHEYRNGLYSTLTYYICKTLVEIPLQLFFPYLYCCFLYWYSNEPGLEDFKEVIFMTDRFKLFFLTTTLCCFIAQGLGFLIGILCVSSFNISIIVSSSALLFLFLFSGFFVRRNQMDSVATGITFLSFIRFGFETIIISIFGKDRCILPEESSVMLTFGLEDKDIQFNLIMLGVHLVVMRLLALFILKAKASKAFLRSFKKYLGRQLDKLRCQSPRFNDRGQVEPCCGLFKIIRFIFWGCVCLFLLQIGLGIIAGIIAAIINATHDNKSNSTNITIGHY